MKELAKYTGTPVAQMVRAGMARATAEVFQHCVTIAEDPKVGGRRRLKALDIIRLCTLIWLYLSPEGRRLGRRRAAGEFEKEKLHIGRRRIEP